MSDVYQCCYTHARRAEGDAVSAGWDTVAVLPEEGVPPEALRQCRAYQNADAPTRPGVVDERGDLLRLYEIAGDGDYVYVLRTQYGHTDMLGRPSMFSHAFFFPLEDPDVLEDPNTFLSLDPGLFQTTEEAAEQWDGQAPVTDPLDLPRAMELAGLDQERWLTLLRCVFAQMSDEKAPQPLYIQYDGSWQQLRALLYCVYTGLPFYLRRRLSVASSANALNLNKHLVFSERAGDAARHLFPETGENTLLTSRLLRKIERYGFVDYAARELDPEEALDFFWDLEDLSEGLGDPSASNPLVLMLACQLSIHEDGVPSFSNEELLRSLSAALRCGVHGDVLENAMAGILDEILSRKLDLTEETDAALRERAAHTASAALVQAELRYSVRQLCRLPDEEAAGILAAMQEEEFTRYRDALIAAPEEGGLRVLEGYYQGMLEEEVDWNLLFQVWDLSAAMPTRPGLAKRMEELAFALYDQDAYPDRDAAGAYERYAALMERLLPELDPGLSYEDCLISALEVFWERVHFSDFSFFDVSQYERLRIETAECRLFLDYAALAQAFTPEEDTAFLGQVADFFGGHVRVRTEDKSGAVKRLYEYLRGQYQGRVTWDYLGWLTAAADADTEELSAGLQAVYDAVTRYDAARLRDAYGAFLDAWRRSRKRGSVRARTLEFVETACKKHDSSADPVPLDLWLLIGTGKPGNCFRVFNDTDAAVLRGKPAQVAGESRLMKLPSYQEAARKYVGNRYKAAKAVKAWLKAVGAEEEPRRAKVRG